MKNKFLPVLIIIITLLQAFCFRLYSQDSSRRHVILVIIDGARYSETLGDTSGKYIPRIKALEKKSTVIDSFYNDGITYTNRAVPAIWSGSWSTPKDTTLPGNISSQYATVPTVWEYFRKSAGKDSTDAMYILKYLKGPWMASKNPEFGPKYWPWYILQGSNDIDVWYSARNKLQQHHPEFTVFYLSDVDHYGHSGNWNDYIRAITTADSIVGMLWDFLQADPVFRDNTDMIITNDHGRHLDGVKNGFVSHGDDCNGCRHIMLLAAGPDFGEGIHLKKKRTIPDIVPTIGKLLNFPTPYVTGSVMTELISQPVKVNYSENRASEYRLYDNYPNPFNPVTNIRYSIGDNSRVMLTIYNALGQIIAVPVNKYQQKGQYEISWEPDHITSGIYIYSLKTVSEEGRISFRSTGKMVYMK